MRRRTLSILTSVTLVALTSCSTADDSERSGPGTVKTAPSPAEAADTVDAVDLSFTAETLDGGEFDGRTLADRPAVLWFWAPWCPTCRAQAPAVSSLAEEYAGQLSVVGVGGLADGGDIRDFAEQVDGPIHLVDVEGEVWRHFGITAQSTYIVVDADGVVVADGYLDDSVLADEVAGLVD